MIRPGLSAFHQTSRKKTAALFWLGLVCIATALPGCATVSIQSVRDPSYTNMIHKLYVIINEIQVDNIDSSYTPLLTSALKNEFSQHGVEINVRSADPLVLDEKNYMAEIESYKPDGVMTIVSTGGVRGPYGGMMQIIYDVSLFDSSNAKRRIWRAQINAAGGTAVREKRMELMAQNLVSRLIEDKLISSEPRSKQQKM